ncbi:unnamed protein product, partial [Effrenium voratum]
MGAGIAMPPPDVALAGPTRAMIKLPKISFSAINGVAVGGGVNLGLLWQDMVFASEAPGSRKGEGTGRSSFEDATFRYPFGELGLSPELGSSVMLPLELGIRRGGRFGV